MSGLSQRALNPWALGVTVFVAAMLIMSGGWQFFIGLAALFGGDIFLSINGYIYSFDTTVWAWIHMILGLVFVIVGFFVFNGRSWAIWAAIGLAVFNGLLNFLWLPTYPIWGVVLIAVDVAIVWALVNSSRSASGS